MTTRFYETFDQGGGTWSATNWTTSVTGTSATIAMAAGQQGSITLPNGSARYVYGIDNYAATSNQEVLVKVNGDQTTARNNALIVGIAMAGPFTSGKASTPTNGIYVYMPGNSNTFTLFNYIGGVAKASNPLTATRAAFNSVFWLRLQNIDGIVKVKSWADGSAEPGTWNDTINLTSYGAVPAGNVVLGAETTSSSTAAETYYFDEVTSTDAAAAGVSGGYTATPATATATAPGGTGAGNARTATITDDAYVYAAGVSTNFGTSTVLAWGGDYRAFVKIPAMSLGADESASMKRLTFTASSATASSVTFNVYSVDAAWNETTITYANRPSVTFVKTVTIPAVAAGGKFSIDLDGVDTTNGISLADNGTGLSTANGYSAEGTTPPVFSYVATPPTGITVPATPATASAVGVNPVVVLGTSKTIAVTPATASVTVPDPVTSATDSVSVSAPALTASASAVQPALYVEHEVVIALEPATADAMMPGGGISKPKNYNVSPSIADADVLEPQTSTERGPRITVAAATGTISFEQPEVNGMAIVPSESDDRYFQRIYSRTPKYYYRLAEPNGVTTGADRMGGLGLIYHGVQTGKHDAPDQRSSVYFDGNSYIEQIEGTTNVVEESVNGTVHHTLEFSLRTSKATQFLMVQADGNGKPNELVMVDGKIVLRNYPYDYRTAAPLGQVIGRTNIADGKWHHIVIRGFDGAAGGGAEIWIDGKFEARKYGVAEFVGFPDFIGARYENFDAAQAPALPGSQYFVGDMSEIAFYDGLSLRSDEISRDYYAFNGWVPFEVTPAEATAEAGNTKGKGSQKKALYLYWWTEREGLRSLPTESVANTIDFDPMPGFINKDTQATPFQTEAVGEYHGFKVFSRPIVSGPYNHYSNYRDPWTDEPALINLETDIDLSEFDVIMFKDWPDEGAELDFVEQNFPGQKDRLISQLMDANDKGIGLYVTSPRMAVDLGIVDDVEFVQTLEEHRSAAQGQGNALGEFDYGTALKFPWDITATDGIFTAGSPAAVGTGVAQNTSHDFLVNKAYYFFDTNKNNRFRVRALVDNLTNIPSYMIQDAAFHVDYDQFGNQGLAFKYLHRDNGLVIGDEYIFNGSAIIDPKFLEPVDYRFDRVNGTWATPAGHVKAGTIVTTFGAKHWLADAEVDNPYKDYATTIVVQPGDSLNGRTVNGKIFCNFTEAPSYGLGVWVQKTPAVDPTVSWPQGYPAETAAQREWEYSWTRTSASITSGQNSINKNVTVNVQMPDGSTKTIGVTTGLGQDSMSLSMVRTSEIFDTEPHVRWEMDGRGMFWLSVKESTNTGDKVIRTTAATATANVVEPKTIAEHPAAVNVQAAIATAQFVKPEEDQTGDVTVIALPATASGEAGGISKSIMVEPATATAEFVENFEIVHAQGEQIVLTLHGYDATLFIKEEA